MPSLKLTSTNCFTWLRTAKEFRNHRFGTDSRQTRSDWPAPRIDWSSPTDDCAWRSVTTTPPPIAHLLAALYASQSQPDLLQTYRQCVEERPLWQHGQSRETARDLLPTSALEALESMEFDENDVSAQKVRERYRLLLRAAHPDSGGDPGSAADRIRSLNEARALLLANLN